MKKILSMILLAVMLLSLLSGCGSNPKNLPGTWYADLDITDNVNVLLTAMIGDSRFEVSDLSVTLVLQLEDDGLYLLEADTNSLSESFSEMMLQLEEDMTMAIESSITEEDMVLSAEEYLNLSGETMESVMDQLAVSLEEAGFVDEVIFSTTSEGSWQATEKTLTFGGTTFSYKLKGDKLTLSGCKGDDPVLAALPSGLEFSNTAP